MNRSIVSRLCATALATACASAGAVPVATYYAYDLHDSADVKYTTATAMSRNGDVTGYVWPVAPGPITGFMSRLRKHFTPLASVPGLTNQEGNGVNDHGEVVGVVSTTVAGVATTQAFITGPNGAGITLLGLLNGDPTTATGVNDAGMVVGRSDHDENFLQRSGQTPPPTCGGLHVAHCFATDAGGANLRDIGALVPGASCTATRVNATGRVTGGSTLQPGDDCYVATHAFLTKAGAGSFANIDTLGGFASIGNAVNASGMVAGEWDRVQFGLQSAFVTGPNGKNMRDLGTLPGGDQAFAEGINVDGNVVGGSSVAVNGVFHAFVTGDGGTGMHDLNDITAGLPTLLQFAVDIDDQGRIVARGDDGHAYLLCPTKGCAKAQ